MLRALRRQHEPPKFGKKDPIYKAGQRLQNTKISHFVCVFFCVCVGVVMRSVQGGGVQHLPSFVQRKAQRKLMNFG